MIHLPDSVQAHINAIPSLPSAVTQLLQLTQEEEPDMQKVARVIAADHALTGRLLQVANSAFYGFPKQISTVRQATIVLGRHAVRNLALSFAVMGIRDRIQEGWPLGPVAFWRHSIAVACCARLMAQRLKLADPEEAFVAGLLHDIGKIILIESEPTAYQSVVDQAWHGEHPLLVCEEVSFGVSHAQVGQALCERWNLPKPLTDVVAHHHDSRPAGGDGIPPLHMLIQDANDLVKLGQFGNGGNPLAMWPLPLWPRPDERMVGTLLDLLHMLPGELHQVQELFFDAPSPRSSQEDARPSEELPVALLTEDDRTRTLLTLILCHMNQTIVADPLNASVVLVSDTVPAARQAELVQSGKRVVPVALAPAMRPPFVHASHLRSQLTQALDTLSPQVS